VIGPESLVGRLSAVPFGDAADRVAPVVAAALRALPDDVSQQVFVATIDPALADTAAFCERYGVALAESANCVVVSGRRGEVTKLAACVVLATTRADVNGLVRRHLDVRKISFADMDVAVSASAMEYGGITPIGLPSEWPVLVDRRVVDAPEVVVGAGVRGAKLVLPGALLAQLPAAEVLDSLGTPVG
jgi:prolyl-tRNA editing enzyme YbaK/EbsC (Cys-tRNA(Pro) deacylase)